MCNVTCETMRVWFSGRTRPCQGRDRGSIPRIRTNLDFSCLRSTLKLFLVVFRYYLWELNIKDSVHKTLLNVRSVEQKTVLLQKNVLSATTLSMGKNKKGTKVSFFLFFLHKKPLFLAKTVDNFVAIVNKRQKQKANI